MKKSRVYNFRKIKLSTHFALLLRTNEYELIFDCIYYSSSRFQSFLVETQSAFNSLDFGSEAIARNVRVKKRNTSIFLKMTHRSFKIVEMVVISK